LRLSRIFFGGFSACIKLFGSAAYGGGLGLYQTVTHILEQFREKLFPSAADKTSFSSATKCQRVR